MLSDIQYNSDYVNYYITDMPKIIPNDQVAERKSSIIPTKKYDYKGSGYNGPQSASIVRRNARERSRVKQVNDGFNALRKRLPASVITALSGNTRRGSGKALSKVDTLRMVVEYIKHLQRVVEESDEALGVTAMPRVTNVSSYETDDAFGRNSPYSELALSPTSSEYSSGVSSTYSQEGYISRKQFNETHHIEEDDILNSICW